jgi:hypothetical protein
MCQFECLLTTVMKRAMVFWHSRRRDCPVPDSRAMEILCEKREILDRGAELLLEKEKIEGEELKALMDVTSSKPSENQKGLV